MTYTPAKIKFFNKTYKTMVSTKPAIIVPHIESNGFFTVNLLVKNIFPTVPEIIAKPLFNQIG